MRSLRFSVRGQLLFIRGGHLRLPLQHPSGEGRHGTILHCLPGPDHQIEKAAGDLAFAQLFLNAQIHPWLWLEGWQRQAVFWQVQKCVMAVLLFQSGRTR